MGIKDKATIAALLLLYGGAVVSARGQERKDSLIRLESAESVEIITNEREESFRKATNARFLHNGTYLLCDTAFWKVDDNIINAIGHVVLEQDNTILTSDKMDYLVDDNLARFRGTLVQLSDSDGNTLRTKFLDYNTSDSVAVFYKGASLKDKDGQIIESKDGTYDSKSKIFTFKGDVNMYTDSVFIRTSSLRFLSASNEAQFDSDIDFWREKNMLSARRGWYRRDSETFFFRDNVHATSENQEAWSDTLYFYKQTNNVLMLGDAQLQDSSRHVVAFADQIYYEDSLSQVTMVRNAAVAIETARGNVADSVFFGADTLVYRTRLMCDIAQNELSQAEGRLNDFNVDPVGEYRAKAAEAAAQAAEQKKAAMAPPSMKTNAPQQPQDSTAVQSAADSTAKAAPADTSLSVQPTDTLPPPPDSTKVGFGYGYGNVRVFRKDIQVRSEELQYSDLDSVARFYRNPLVWNEGNRQYTSDSLFCLIQNGSVTKASLLSNAFIITEETAELYDQIKGAEVMAYFDSATVLKRFDALGGASAIFYLVENDEYSTVNKVESKMFSATFTDGQIDRVYYYDTPKNDAYPVVQFPQEDRQMKGFSWQPELRPEGRHSITALQDKPSQRTEYAKHPKTKFVFTDKFFPGYMKELYAGLHRPKPRKTKPSAPMADTLASVGGTDSLEVAAADSLAASVSDSLAAPADSLGAPADSLAAAADSLAAVPDSLLSPSELRKRKAAQRQARIEAREKARQEAREARWKILDERDAARQAEKDRKAQIRYREKVRRELIAKQKEERRDQARLQRYIENYQKKLKWKKSKTDSSATSESTPSPVKNPSPSPAPGSSSNSSGSLKANFTLSE